MKERKEINIQIGDRIRKARENAGYTQEKLAELVDISIQYTSDLERGIVGASVSTIIRICKALNVSSDLILLGRDDGNDLSEIVERLRYLPKDQLQLVERGINLLLEALSKEA